MGAKQRYDKKIKVTRILLSDYLVLKRIGQTTGISMAEALHRLIEDTANQTQEKVSPQQLYFQPSIIRSRQTIAPITRQTVAPITRQTLQYPKVERR